MTTQIFPFMIRLGPSRYGGILAATLLTVGALGGGALSMMRATGAAAVEHVRTDEIARRTDIQDLSALTGSYVVTGTDADGRPYARAGIVGIALAPSGALELEWDGGRQVGVGHLVGNILAVASTVRGRTMILLMNINPDGSLTGKWSRRTDRGSKGTETWKKT